MVVRAKGINCEVELFDHHILIKRTGPVAACSRLGGDKSVPLSSITSVQFRRAGMFSPGFIKFGILGEADPGWDKLIHPNVVGFRSSQQKSFERIRDAISASINVPSLAALASQYAAGRADRIAAQKPASRPELKQLPAPNGGDDPDVDSARVDWDSIPPLNPSVSAWLRKHKIIRIFAYGVIGFFGLTFLVALFGGDSSTDSGATEETVAEGNLTDETSAADMTEAQDASEEPQLTEFVGSYPSDEVRGTPFWNHSAVYELVGRTIDDPTIAKMILGGGVEGKIVQRGEWVRAYACMPHNCAGLNWSVIIKANGTTGAVCYHNDDDDRDGWYDGVSVSVNEGGCMPAK